MWKMVSTVSFPKKSSAWTFPLWGIPSDSYVVINLICGNRKQITPLMFVLAVLFICKYIFL